MAKILLVEDRDSLRRMLTRALGEERHEVIAEADLAPGLARLAGEERFDLVLTDLMLPGGSGLELVSAARARRPETPVVVLTGFGTVAAAVDAMKRGAADFLEKPVDLEALFRLVRESTTRLRAALKCEGMNVGINLGTAAGAGIAEHLHVHIVPRWPGDTNFMPVLADVRVVPQALEATRDHLLGFFADLPAPLIDGDAAGAARRGEAP